MRTNRIAAMMVSGVMNDGAAVVDQYWLMVNTTRVTYAGIPAAGFAANNNLNAGANDYVTAISGVVTERCRQNGYIRQVKVMPNNVGTDRSIKFKVFRYNGSTYDFVSESGWETLTVEANQTQTIELGTPMTCLPGDILGFTVVGNVATAQRIACKTKASTADSIRYVYADVTSANAFASTVSNLSIDIEATGASPYLAITGDSIAAGYNQWQTHYNTGPAGTLANTWTQELRDLTDDTAAEGFEYQNFGKGAEDFAWVLATGFPAAEASGAKVIYIHCGVNDINTSRTWAAVESDLDAIKVLFDASTTAEKLVIGEILPWTNGTDEQAGTVRTWNASLAAWCTANGATLALTHDAMGQTRISTGELDDLATAYDDDGVHLTAAGQAALAALVDPYLEV